VNLQVPVGDDWREIDDTREYMVVVPDFLYGGGDGYQMPEGRSGSRTGAELKYLVLDAILALQSQGKTVGTPIDSSNARIVPLDGDQPACFP